MSRKKIEYNDIPVLYCSRCLSLLIMEDEVLGDYCHECGCTDISSAYIWEWEEEYEKKFGHKPFNNK